MISYDRFCEIAESEAGLLPDYVHDELNGGVLTDPSACLHPGRVADDLYILGTYSIDPVMGRQIVLYYGSFAAVLGEADERTYQTRLRETIRHEFRHHLEARAGMRKKGTLVEEDEERMRTYYRRHGYVNGRKMTDDF